MITKMKNLERIALYSVIILLLTYRFLDNVKDTAVSPPDIPTLLRNDSLIADAINNGNKKSFKKLVESRLLIEGDRSLFYYSLLMANRHNDWRAYDFLFRSLSYEENNRMTINGIKYFKNDKITEGLAIYYLLKSYEFGNPDTSKYELKQYFKNKIPNSNEYMIRILQESQKTAMQKHR